MSHQSDLLTTPPPPPTNPGRPRSMRIGPRRRLPAAAAVPRRPLHLPAGSPRTGTDSTIVVLESDDGPRRRGGDGAARRVLRAGLRRRHARRRRRARARCCSGATRASRGALRAALDRAMLGQPNVKSALDMAIHDLAAQAAGVPLVHLPRRPLRHERRRSTARSRRTRPTRWRASAAAYVAAGYRRIQVKVGGDPVAGRRAACARCARPCRPGVVLFCDANGAWTTGQARAFLRATRDLDITLEQPCMAYDDCRTRAPALPASARAGRVHRLAARAARGAPRRRRRRRHDQDRPRRRRRRRRRCCATWRSSSASRSRSRTPAAATSTPPRWRTSRSRRPRSCASTPSTSTPGSRSATRRACRRRRRAGCARPTARASACEVLRLERWASRSALGLTALSRPT